MKLAKFRGIAKIFEHNLLDVKSVVDRRRYHMAAKFGNIFLRFGSKLYRQIVGIPILLLQICSCFFL